MYLVELQISTNGRIKFEFYFQVMRVALTALCILGLSFLFSTMNPFKNGKCGNKLAAHLSQKRRHHRLIVNRARKQRVRIGPSELKNDLKTSMLNINGLSDQALADVDDFVLTNQPDIVFLLETKRRYEELCSDISIQGYNCFEVRRSDVSGHRDGGGIACYTRISDGLVIRQYCPDIPQEHLEYVNNERAWVKVESLQSKTAVLGVYMGCQYPDDRHGEWNDGIYWVLSQEIHKLRSEGYRIKFAGDMNGHVGSVLGQGVIGNNPNINRNGQRFLDFLRDCNLRHINGECRTPGDPGTKICEGLWTRQCANSRSVIDFAGVSAEDVDSVLSMHIDDVGALGGNSDHNWITLSLKDKFRRLRLKTSPKKKERWNIAEDQDWSKFKQDVLTNLPNIHEARGMTVNALATAVSTALYSGGLTSIGFKPSQTKSTMKSRSLPNNIVKELKKKRELESAWKTLRSSHMDNAVNVADLTAAETKGLQIIC